MTTFYFEYKVIIYAKCLKITQFFPKISQLGPKALKSAYTNAALTRSGDIGN